VISVQFISRQKSGTFASALIRVILSVTSVIQTSVSARMHSSLNDVQADDETVSSASSIVSSL
jgi:hypothetical protein